jgi:hypothetical protein
VIRVKYHVCAGIRLAPVGSQALGEVVEFDAYREQEWGPQATGTDDDHAEFVKILASRETTRHRSSCLTVGFDDWTSWHTHAGIQER